MFKLGFSESGQLYTAEFNFNHGKLIAFIYKCSQKAENMRLKASFHHEHPTKKLKITNQHNDIQT